jgi:hypothetical protein
MQRTNSYTGELCKLLDAIELITAPPLTIIEDDAASGSSLKTEATGKRTLARGIM